MKLIATPAAKYLAKPNRPCNRNTHPFVTANIGVIEHSYKG